MVSKDSDARQDKSKEAEELLAKEMGAEVINSNGSMDLYHSLEELKPVDGPRYLDSELRQITNFEEYLQSLGDAALDSDDFVGTGAEILRKDDPKRLVGVPLAVIQWNFTESKDYEGTWFVYCEIIDNNNRRYAMASSAKFGIRDDLAKVSMSTGQYHGFVARKGLAHREYPWTDETTGEKKKVSVFSIAQ